MLEQHDNRAPLAQLLLAELLIGSVGVFVHESGQDAVTAVFYRCLFGSLFLLAWAWRAAICVACGGSAR